MRPELRYEVVLYWSDTDQSFVAEIPELPGCMADGETYAAALANAEIIAREWIETAMSLGRTVPEAKTRLRLA